MAKGQMRGNRETKKPKQNKVKATPATAMPPGASTRAIFSPGKKK